MKKLALAVGLLLFSTGQAFAGLMTCGSGTTAVSAGSAEIFSNSFLSAQSFSDCYAFSIDSHSDAFGGTLTIDPLSFLDIDINTVTLSGAGLDMSLVDFTAGVFSFSDLIAGTYQLVVSGLVTKGTGLDDTLSIPVGYAGSITTNTIAAVPEPASLGMFALALMCLAVARRRKT